MVGESVLELRSQIIDHLGKDPDFEEVVRISPFVVLKQVNYSFNELEEAGLRVAGNNNKQAQKLKDHISNKWNTISIEVFVNSCQDSLNQGISFTNQTIEHGHFSCHQEISELLLNAFKSRDCNMRVGNTSFNKGLCLLVVFSLDKSMSTCA